MLKKRNAQGLPIRVIVLAIIGLIVLVVLIIMFSKESGKSVSVLGSCETRGGNCDKSTCDDGEREIVGAQCKDSDGKIITGKTCCVSID
jgi:hypothetical protein